MPNPCRLFLRRRSYSQSSIATVFCAHLSTRYHVQHPSSIRILRPFSSAFHARIPQFPSPIANIIRDSLSTKIRCLCSDPDPEHANLSTLYDILGKSLPFKELWPQLRSMNFTISDECIFKAFQNLDSNYSPVVASKLLDLVLKFGGEKLTSKSYNVMLDFLAMNGFDKEFWELVDHLKKKPFGISEVVYVRVLGKLQKDRSASELERLRELRAKCFRGQLSEPDGDVVMELILNSSEESSTEKKKKMDRTAWERLIMGHCLSGDLAKATHCYLQFLVEEKVSSDRSLFEKLIVGHCLQQKSGDGYNLLKNHANKNHLVPSTGTFETLLRVLFMRGNFAFAISLVQFMTFDQTKDLLDIFCVNISKSGTVGDARRFLHAMRLHDDLHLIPVSLRLFNACFELDKHRKAQDILVMCPDHIKNEPVVLKLFYSAWCSREGTTS